MANDADIESNCDEDESTSTLSQSTPIKTITKEEAEDMLEKIYNAICLARTYKMLLLSGIIFILPTLSIILGIVFMVKRHVYYCVYEICAALIPSICLTICNRIWTYKLYKPNNTRTHFLTGIVFAIFNIEALYYYQNYLPRILKTVNKSKEKVAIFKNDCRDFLCCALVLQALSQIGVQVYILYDYVQTHTCNMWHTSALQIIILCLSIYALFVAGFLSFKYDFCVGLSSYWRVSLFLFISKCFIQSLNIMDLILDWILVCQFLYEQQWVYAGLTLLFMIVPSIAITWMVSRTVTVTPIKIKKLNPGPKCLIYIFSIMPIINRIAYLIKMLKVKELEIQEVENTNNKLSNSFKEFIPYGFAVQYSNIIENYMENTMQTILQIAIVANTKEYGAVSVTKISLSLLTMSLAMSIWERQERIYEKLFIIDSKPTDKIDPNQSLDIIALATIGVLTIGPRILAFGVFASVQPMYTAVWIIASWVIVITHSFCTINLKNTKEFLSILTTGIFYIFKPIVKCVCFIETIFYIVYLCQNILAIRVWYLYNTTSPYSLFIYRFCIIAPIIGFIGHCIYKCWLAKKILIQFLCH